MTIDHGNVGIGTMSPTAKLHVNSVYPEIMVLNSNQTEGGIQFTRSDNPRGMIGYGDLCGGGDTNGLTI